MFCPSCGVETQGTQNFCKSCGTDLQVVSDAMTDAGDSLGQLRIDLAGLEDKIRGFLGPLGIGDDSRRSQHARKRNDAPPPVKPRVWLSYSRQHNVRNGLISLLSGAGLGALLYYLGRAAIDSGLLADIQAKSGEEIRGLEQIVLLLWMVALIPVCKGIAQLTYAVFFAEPISTLAARFAPAPPPVQLPVSQATGPMEEQPALDEAPPSVTEGTTRIFEGARAAKPRETR